MDVLDIPANDINGDITKLDLRSHQYSGCALMIRKTRSTSVAVIAKKRKQRRA